ncbi:uncharacterized protein LOC126891059 [Diabrotica virgifera virgifera]|uniref:Tc1-like transposase DDE domain-containing protein n=1 Tax=Diabrotica virgifera virgifera TaxID=50390 RepID=A0ABM5L180_DIAVI|nr:uncharacterized protein LOC126891059 [Diabrotica virgifera virgifera]
MDSQIVSLVPPPNALTSTDAVKLQGNETAQILTRNAYHFFSLNHLPNENPVELTSKCLQISISSVRRFKDGPHTGTHSFKHTINRKRKLTRDLDDSVKNRIRSEIYRMYEQKLPLTISSLLTVLREKFIYEGGKTSLFHILKEIGFSYKRDNPQKHFMEASHVVEMRHNFLRMYHENDQKGANKMPLIFLDETWIFSSGSVRSWQDGTNEGIRKRTGDGMRYIILHAGSENGFIDGSSLIFKSGSKTGDYHGEMDGDIFESWLKKDLLPRLQEPSMIVLDNASYHSRQINKWPTQSWKKDELVEWLRSKGIVFPPNSSKTILLDITKALPRPPKHYAVDQLINKAGHEVLRLPPYHCHFNAIEMVLSQTKRFYDQHILANKNVLEVWETALNNVTRTSGKIMFAIPIM